MKKLFVISAVALAVITGCAQQYGTAALSKAEQQQAAAIIVSPNDQREYKTITLPNKIEVVLVSDPSSEKSAASLSVAVGMLQDPMSQQGMAHYLEHMLFLGTERFPDTAEYGAFMSQNGGAANAYTWLDITNYMFQVNNGAFEEGLDRFSDFFKAPKLYPEYADKERNAVNAEQSMRREVDFLGQFELMRRMFGEHPSNRFLAGSLESLSDKPDSNLYEETVKFYNDYYSANIMKVALLSNRPLAEMELLARQHFSSIENKNIDKPAVTAELDYSLFAPKRIHYLPNQDVKQLRLEFVIKDNSDQFALKPNEFVSYLLNSEMPGTPAYQLKNLGLISSLNVSANPSFFGNYGNISIDLNLTDAGMQQREAITAVVMQYIDLIREQGVDSKYFNEIRTSLDNRFRFLEKTDGFNYVAGLTASMLNVPTRHIINAPYHFERFEPAAIKQVLDQMTPAQLRVWYISQQEPADTDLVRHKGRYKIADITPEEISTWQRPVVALNLPQVNRLLPESFDLKAPQALDKPIALPEMAGIKAWFYPSQAFADQPRGRLDIYLNNATPLTDVKAKVMLSLWRDLYNLEQSVLATEASVAGIFMRLSESNGLLLNVDGFTDKQPLLVDQALAGIIPTVSDERLAQAVDRLVRGLRNQSREAPFRQAFNAFGTLYRGGNYNNEQMISAAQQLTVADLQAFMQQTLAANQVRVFAFGNYDQADVEQLVSTIAKRLPTERQVTEYVRTPVWLPKPGEVITLMRDIDVTDVAVVDMHIHPEPTIEQLARARLLQSHFSNQVFDKLRTEEQLAYAVGGTAVQLEDYTAFGMYIQTPVMAPEPMQQRFETFKQQYGETLAKMQAAEFEQLKQSLLVSLKEPPKNLREEMAPIVSDWYQEKFNYDSRARLIAAVEQQTLPDIQAFYQQTLLNPQAARISVQMRGTSFQDKPFATIPGQQVITDLAEFHQRMSKQ
ncbi:insulinase family protein [Arsukibacterium sp.]|uniref:insulinase family protein n=1 Tax=Arsukibacterium sp. TaxID=1977258 RepID=UPI002FD94F69